MVGSFPGEWRTSRRGLDGAAPARVSGPMISVIIRNLNSAPRLQAVLTSLVPAAAEGIVRQVIVLDGGSTDGSLEICDDAGADILDASLLEALDQARGGWILLAPIGIRLRRGWEAQVQSHIEADGGPALLLGAQARDKAGLTGWLDRLRTPNGAAILAPAGFVRKEARQSEELDQMARRLRGAPRLF